MKRIINTLIISLCIWGCVYPAYAHSVRHHLIDTGKNFTDALCSPLYGIFIQGPKNIKDAYQYEVWGREKEEERGLLRYRLFAIWRAPGEEMKGIIDGLVGSITSLGKSGKEFLSIFFSD